MKKVALYTLGCKLNYAEGETLLNSCQKQGYTQTEFGKKADLILINTCSVTDQADQKCRRAITKARRSAPAAQIVVVGCYAQLQPHQIAQIPGVDHVIGTQEKFNFFRDLSATLGGPQIRVSDIAEVRDFQPSSSSQTRTRAVLKVQDGCDYGCSFCTIPKARGTSRSASFAVLDAAIDRFHYEGVQEAVLSGVNVGDFSAEGLPKSEGLLTLIHHLDARSGPPRFRISSIEPNLLSSSIIEFVATHHRWMPHFHIPLQSGSDRILGLMRRRYRTHLYVSRIKEIRKHMPEACIGADVIIGFPSETEADFKDTYELIRSLDINYLHVFPYAERSDTIAAEMNERIDPQVRKQRAAQLRQLSLRKKINFYKSQIASKRSLLLEDDMKEGFQLGYTDNYLRVGLPEHRDLRPGQIHKVEIKRLHPTGFLEAALVV